MKPTTRKTFTKARVAVRTIAAAAAALVAAAAMATPASASMAAGSAVLDAFGQHRIVALGQVHDLRQEDDFILRLLRHARFAATVDSIVLEFGNARYQRRVDRYVAGADVPLRALRPVWRDLVATGPGMLDGPAPFFAAVRRLNRALPPPDRVRVALGDPAFDWATLRGPEQFERAVQDRDRVFAAAAEREARQGRRVLLLSGFMHFARVPRRPFGENSVRILERREPGRVRVILPYAGGVRYHRAFERRFVARRPSIALRPLSGRLGRQPADRILPRWYGRGEAPGPSPYRGLDLRSVGDALISFGPCSRLRPKVVSRAPYRDPEYLAEMDRRNRILFGEPFVPPPAEPTNEPYCPNTGGPVPIEPPR